MCRWLRSKTNTINPASSPTESATTDSVSPSATDQEKERVGLVRAADQKQIGSLLIFVPRDSIGILINRLTGNYGYSHLAIDCGESDVATGKRLMIEATGAGVHNTFQDKYGKRKFVRISLQQVGVNVDQFCACVRSKLGEIYDDEEALTFGVVDHPAKQICSDLVTICLPEDIRADIAQQHLLGNLHRRAAIRVYGKLNSSFRLFVSPNGFAEYFGAPPGNLLERKDQLAEPMLRTKQMSGQQQQYQRFGIAILIGFMLLWLFLKSKLPQQH